MSIVSCVATVAVPAAAPRFAGLRRVAGPAALNRDVEQPSVVSLQVSAYPVPPRTRPNRGTPRRSIQRIGNIPGVASRLAPEIFPRAWGPDPGLDARRGGPRHSRGSFRSPAMTFV